MLFFKVGFVENYFVKQDFGSGGGNRWSTIAVKFKMVLNKDWGIFLIHAHTQ